ncbi:TPA: hypothetical protein QDA94_003041 [Burkholderia vietnamiensis]|uniref:Uncharacterized protein n=1 Tax=Burkholderia vietnamiensis TaxID=60552 RepID=A0AA44Y402_BURVI|nr:hypothetical protein [Burkholderia vietnamiensis]PRH43147.1 hypothetical protein C6T65_06305 [Burkholderia vietnamiensis]HDR9048808.1 hypothetical protein [Burkholderia vietnamiensis]HDR9081289.1 hypothetical protein [Burkholderia vietnamiensis]HDR9231368.1 hypothetical protein [Burkholderia vietnamiensis]
MTDRELLELAAKAANQERSFAGDLWSSARGCLWDPLGNDGDALRLAVALRIDLHFEEQPSWCGEIVEAFSPMREDGSRHCEMRELKPDPNAATRRAIVRAAAEIGKRGA